MGDGKKAGRIDVMTVLGGPDDDDEAGASSSDMACKAMWKAIKGDDYEGFKMALNDYLGYRESDVKTGVEAAEAED